MRSTEWLPVPSVAPRVAISDRGRSAKKYMKLLHLYLAIALLFSGNNLSALILPGPYSQPPLTDLTPIFVSVKGISETSPLYRKSKVNIELALRKANLTLSDAATDSQLTVQVNIHLSPRFNKGDVIQYVYFVVVGAYAQAVITPTETEVYARIWSSDTATGLSNFPELHKDIETAVADLTNQFLNEYLKANPQRSNVE